MVQLSNDQLKQLSTLITPKQTEMESQMKILVNKVEKLDKLDGLVVQVANLAKSVEFVHETVNTIKKENIGMKEDIKRIKEENSELKKRVVDLQARSMRDNLLFFNIRESDGEDPESLVKELIKEELKISEDVEFARVHRIGRKAPHKIRPIVAKFEKYKMREKVKFEGWKRIKEMKELKSNPVPGLNMPVDPKFVDFGIGEQFPTEIYKTRKELLPIYRRALANKQNAKLIVDKLYINGKPYNLENNDNNEHIMTESA